MKTKFKPAVFFINSRESKIRLMDLSQSIVCAYIL